ncbi:MAG: substrate-binding domain-containing protein [Planctomycetaceae bacterium]|jgi:ABC-type molybdate transport system substrate-binding protein|nr:substrate-binding domain-containing protein [Planctomycetaceae bacterium]
MRLFFISFLFSFYCVVFIAGCSDKTTLKIYCDELFWEVIWEESFQFQRVYGKQVEILRNYPTETAPENSDSAHEQVKESYVPAPWRNMPKIDYGEENNNQPKIVLNNNVTKIIFDLRETLPGDMYLTESGLQTTILQEQSLVAREYPFCYLTMVLLVPKGNPLFIKSVRQMLDRQYRLGIAEPSITGMGNAAWDIITKINETKTKNNKKTKNKNINENENENENIKIYDTIKALLEALEQNQIDAALIWDACAKKAENYAEIVPLGKNNIQQTDVNQTNLHLIKETKSNSNSNSKPENTNNSIDSNSDETTELHNEHRLIRVSIVSLTIAHKEPYCRRFADFLISTEGQRILKRHGFTPTGK